VIFISTLTGASFVFKAHTVTIYILFRHPHDTSSYTLMRYLQFNFHVYTIELISWPQHKCYLLNIYLLTLF